MGIGRSRSCMDTPEKRNTVATPVSQKQSNDTTNDARFSLTIASLPYIIDSYDGLLDELLMRGILDQEQVQLIEKLENRSQAARQLLDDVNKLTHDKKETFPATLDETQQSHVANFIRNHGLKPATIDDDNWPAIDEYHRVEKNWSRLVELIDSRNGLRNELLSTECISYRYKELLDRYEVITSRNKELLYMMKRKSGRDFKKFIECLMKTKQHHVAALLDSNIAQNVQPVDEKEVASLMRNYSALVQLIDLTQASFLSELLSADVITWYQREFIESASTASESNERLLDCMKRGCQRDYDNFIKCLYKTGQELVVYLLRSDGVVAEIDAQASLSSTEEDTIVEEFSKYYHKSSTEARQQLFDRLFEALQDPRLIAMQTKHSIKLFFICESLSGLLHLHELYSFTKLSIIIQQLFKVLLNDEQHVEVILNWNGSNYNNCIQILSGLYELPVYSHIHQPAQLQSPNVTNEHSAFSVDMKEILPHELIELFIIKAACELFVALTKMTSRADVCSLTTLNSVCRYWWQTLTYRQSNKQILRQCFEHNSAPYRFNPKLVTSLSIQNCHVSCVAELDDKLYIAVLQSNTVRVWSRVKFSFCELKDIKVPDLLNPVHIVACSMKRCLYISDRNSRCIWRVNLYSFNAISVEKFITLGYEPFQISIQPDRLLVTAFGGRSLCIYSCSDGALLRKIGENNDDVIDNDEAQSQIDRLLRYVNIEHAVETTDGRLLVRCRPRNTEESKDRRRGVNEITADGQVLRTYVGTTDSNRFFHLTVDCRNHILVCDSDKRQVLHLNSKLMLQQVLLTGVNGNPQRLCYSEQTGLLYICYNASSNIDVYKVTSY